MDFLCLMIGAWVGAAIALLVFCIVQSGRDDFGNETEQEAQDFYGDCYTDIEGNDIFVARRKKDGGSV